MIKKLKYRLSTYLRNRRMQTSGQARFMACTLAAVTLLGSPMQTVEFFNGHNLLDVKPQTAAETQSTYTVYITNNGTTKEIEFAGGTVEEALVMAGFTPDAHDFVEPSLDTVITDTAYIDYVDVNYVHGSYTKKVPYETETVYDNTKNQGYCQITEGKNGKKKVTYTKTVINGRVTEKEITGSKILAEPENAVKTLGTKTATVKKTGKRKAVGTYDVVNAISTLVPKIVIKLDKNGVPTKYKKKMTVRATAYTYTGNNCSTGVAPQPGYIAVNPRVIPYGTKMYIKSPNGKIIYGYAVAADTGGFIRNHPTGIDLFMSTASACTNFGVRQMEIYILE